MWNSCGFPVKRKESHLGIFIFIKVFLQKPPTHNKGYSLIEGDQQTDHHSGFVTVPLN